ncbi:Hypothetical_protein [Hexamita inflata]|uniref:Hypothetical_protein n=1 Tax=Hexamita inflata TaxID=28002 RepID=A0AA86PVQ9_9EUKA|nr:Hypothetical protein HINF_LOCUS29617 [Hexamita inflata]
MNELIQLYKIFQIIQVKILVACKFQIEQELSYSTNFLNNDYELATQLIQVVDQPRTFILRTNSSVSYKLHLEHQCGKPYQFQGPFIKVSFLKRDLIKAFSYLQKLILFQNSYDGQNSMFDYIQRNGIEMTFVFLCIMTFLKSVYIRFELV